MNLVKQKLGKVSITVEKDYWTNQKSYDKLVIVEVLNVGSYISRKFVPNGISFSNREYWIKIGRISGNEESSYLEFPITTEFGDSVDVTIAQKTITDKLLEITNAISEIEAGISSYITKQTASILTLDDIPSIANAITELEGHIDDLENTLNQTVSDVLSHTTAISILTNDITNIKSHNTDVDNMLITLLDFKENILTSVWQSKIYNTNVLYISGRVTEESNDSLLYTKLTQNLNLGKDGDVIIRLPSLTSSVLRNVIDNPEGYNIDNLIDTPVIIVQFDSSSETIGEYDYQNDIIDLDEPDNYPNTFIGNVLYFLDTINIEFRNNNLYPNIYFVVPPTLENKITYALKDIVLDRAGILINPFKNKYDYNIITTIKPINNVNKTVLKESYINHWAEYIICTIKQTM